jgi:hypothetical protein
MDVIIIIGSIIEIILQNIFNNLTIFRAFLYKKSVP